MIFLDDLQFSDASTLNLIRWLATARDLKRLLVIGAYRSNEVDVGHPLRLALNEIEETRTRSTSCRCGRSISPPSSSSWRIRSTLTRRLRAARGIAARAGGRQSFLSHRDAEDARAVAGDRLRARSRPLALGHGCSSGRAESPRNVVDFVDREAAPARRRDAAGAATSRLHRQHLRSEDAVDHQRTIDGRHGREPAAGASAAPASRRRTPTTSSSASRSGPRRPPPADAQGFNPIYRFQHDRVQQAAYALIDEDRQQAVHLSIGRLIQSPRQLPGARGAADRDRRPPERRPPADRRSGRTEGSRAAQSRRRRSGAALVRLRSGDRAISGSARNCCRAIPGPRTIV